MTLSECSFQKLRQQSRFASGFVTEVTQHVMSRRTVTLSQNDSFDCVERMNAFFIRPVTNEQICTDGKILTLDKTTLIELQEEADVES